MKGNQTKKESLQVKVMPLPDTISSLAPPTPVVRSGTPLHIISAATIPKASDKLREIYQYYS